MLQVPLKTDGHQAAHQAETGPEQPVGEGAGARSRLLRRLLVILVSVCATLAALEATARFLVVLGHPPQGLSRQFDRKLAQATLPPDGDKPVVFFMGTSLTSRAVYADLLAARLAEAGIDADVRNIACSATWPKDEVFLLKQAMEAGNKPSLVVCDLAPSALNIDRRYSTDYSPGLLDSYVGRSQVKQPHDVPGIVDQLLNRNSFLYAYRGYLKEQLAGLFDKVFSPGKELTPGVLATVSAEEDVSPYGWAPAYRVAGPKGLKERVVVRDRQLKNIARRRVRADIANYDWAAPLQQFCSDNNIPLVFVWLPVHPVGEEFYRLHLNLSFQDCEEAFLAAAKRSGSIVLDLHDSDTDPYHFVDFEHLNPAGAAQVTERIAGG